MTSTTTRSATTAREAITVAGLTRSFKDVRALDNVSLTIAPNSICGLLGSNGAGKTTLMSIIAGHDRATSGQVSVFGDQPFESTSASDSTSFIRDNQRYPDDYTLHHVLTAARVFHSGWDQKFAEQLVEQFKLPTKTQVKKYSRGQLSAIAIIVGLASRAPLTILDEPYLGLDIAARRRFYELLLEDYNEHPRTLIVSTHLVEEMEAIFDHIVVLNQGKVALDATPDDLAESAFELTGQALDVEAVSAQFKVLHLRKVGSLASAVVLGRITPEQERALREHNVTARPAPIHDLVAAIGNSYDANSNDTSSKDSSSRGELTRDETGGES